MKCVLVWLVVVTTTFHTSQAVCEDGGTVYENGDIIVRGIHTSNFIAGRLEVCVEAEWRAVCDSDTWTQRNVRVACRQLGLNESETIRARACRDSCFGQSDSIMGIGNFNCSGDESQLISCGGQNTNGRCEEDAGVICNINRMTIGCPTSTLTTCPSTTCPTSVETTDATTTEDGLTVGMVEENEQSESCTSLAALGGGLGGLCAILAILLVGVVMGWVWTCQRTGKTGFKKGANTGAVNYASHT